VSAHKGGNIGISDVLMLVDPNAKSTTARYILVVAMDIMISKGT
jgi:hypothetical protein